MKLILPPLKINKDVPFGNDLFGREEFANRLFNLISRLDDNLVISINAPWGDGKTTFVHMWQAYLEQKGVRSIYFDAFANDYLEEAFISIVGEIAAAIEKEFGQDIGHKEKIKSFKKRAALR